MMPRADKEPRAAGAVVEMATPGRRSSRLAATADDAPAAAASILAARDLTISYGEQVAVDQVSMSIPERRIVGWSQGR